LGVALSPAHFPHFSRDDFNQFFDEAAEIGSNVTWICEWESVPTLDQIRFIQMLTVQHGLKFHLYLSPIALSGGRKNPAIPASVGGTSFDDPKVRSAYKEQVLTLASVNPDYLGLATEVNFLVQNPRELNAFASLTHEAYQAIKEKYPSQSVTISFQWDVMSNLKHFSLLRQFRQSLDVYSFTSYPDAFGDPAKIPADYYSSVRT